MGSLRRWSFVGLLLLFPAGVFVGGAQLMSAVSHRPTIEGLTPLNQRWLGYDTEAVGTYWGELKERNACPAEAQFLRLDLGFPIIYGGALTVSLLAVSSLAGVPGGWVALPVLVTVLADWTETVLQLGQLQDFTASGETVLDSRRIRIASAATVVKLICFVLSFAVLAGLGARALRAAPRAAVRPA
jgi:hypothetical protein